MPSKIQIITNEHQEELKEHGTYEFPVLVSDEALSRFYTSSFQWHWHTEIELTLITEGTMVYQINDQIFLSQGRAGALRQLNTMHTGRMENGRDCRYISITFHPRLLYGYQGSRIASRYTDPLMENAALPAVCFDLSQEWHGEAVGLLEDIIRIDSLRYDTYEMDIQMDLFRFWKLLYLHCRPDREPAHTAGRKNQERIRQMLSFIHENYQSDITLDDISRHIHICKSECCRVFKGYMKESLFEYLLKYRIEKEYSRCAGGKADHDRDSHKGRLHRPQLLLQGVPQDKGLLSEKLPKNPVLPAAVIPVSRTAAWAGPLHGLGDPGPFHLVNAARHVGNPVPHKTALCTQSSPIPFSYLIHSRVQPGIFIMESPVKS